MEAALRAFPDRDGERASQLQRARDSLWEQLRNAPPTLAGRMFAWVQDGVDDRSRAALRATILRPVLFVFSRVPGRSYHREVSPVWR